MKKSLVLLIALFTAGLLSAQRLGVQGGYSLSTPFIGTEDNAVDFNARSGSGFHIGALFDWDVTNRWGFEAAVLYNMRTAHFNMAYRSILRPYSTVKCSIWTFLYILLFIFR